MVPGAIIGYSGYTPRTLRAFLWMKTGDRDQALPLIDAALEQNRTAIAAGDRGQSPRYENAALQLMRGDRAAALEWLDGAYKAGFLDADFMRVDPLLAPLAGEPGFRQMVEPVERDLREMRARLDLSDLDDLAKGGR